MKRQHTYRREKDRIGAQGCIYCNGPAPLTLEHIIPEKYWGNAHYRACELRLLRRRDRCVRGARLSRNVADAETNEISAKKTRRERSRKAKSRTFCSDAR